MSLQAPLTTKDTAVLSGSLSTHNGNGGGTINLALRRVTSANGWGEVRLLHHLLTVSRSWFRLTLVVWHSSSEILVCETVGVWTQVELGAGDTHGPLFGMKIFRNLTPRWWVWKADKRYPCFVSLTLEPLSFLNQLCDGSVWTPVFIPGCASWLYHSAGPSPGQEHDGISAVALGYPVLHEHQRSQRHQEQPFHLCDAGEQPAVWFHFPFFAKTLKLPFSVRFFAKVIVSFLFLFAAWHSSHFCDDELPV